jgi:hypothetical protein
MVADTVGRILFSASSLFNISKVGSSQSVSGGIFSGDCKISSVGMGIVMSVTYSRLLS